MPTIPCHGTLTTLSEIAPTRVEPLRALLKRIDKDVETNTLIPFGKLNRVHFARLVILDAAQDRHGAMIPAQLLFATDFDGTIESHVDELLTIGGLGFLEVYSHCTGFVTGLTRTTLRNHWLTGALRVGASFVGTPGRFLTDLRNEAALRCELERVVDAHRRQWVAANTSATQIHQAIRSAIRNNPAFAWVWTRRSPPWRDRIRWVDGTLPVLASLLALGLLFVKAGVRDACLLLLGAVLLLLFLLRLAESRNRQEDDHYDRELVRRLSAREDCVVQNQMTGIVLVQPGWFRQFTLRTVLGIVHLAATYVFTRGALGQIPSIHFARWVLVDRGRRLLFLSNFDGSWESYLGDFIDKAAFGLTLIWSNCWGFPDTRWLAVQGGARDARRFKAYARNSQAVTDVWYSAHKRWSIQNLTDNAALRAGLRDPLTDEECAVWCRRL